MSHIHLYYSLFHISTVEGTNIALQGIATQVSTAIWPTAYAQYAIDGNYLDANRFHRSCSLSNSTKDPWWKVTFTEYMLATVVVITNRADCCGAFLNSVIFVKKSFPKYPNLSLLEPAFCILSFPQSISGLITN